MLNNNKKVWANTDFLNYYAKHGKEDYISLQKYCQERNISLKMAVVILHNASRNYTFNRSFRAGTYKFPPTEEIETRNQVLENADKAISYINSKTGNKNKFVNSLTFKQNLLIFFNIKCVDFSIFMKKLEYRLDLLRACPTSNEYLRIFIQIYNWKNQNPISFNETELDQE